MIVAAHGVTAGCMLLCGSSQCLIRLYILKIKFHRQLGLNALKPKIVDVF